jgi:hypothetical protein
MQSGDRVEEPPMLFTPPKLFSGTQLLVAALFGLPITVALLASLNFRRLGELPRANSTLLLGVVLSVGVVAAVALLPDSFARLMPLVASIGTWQWVRHAQREALLDVARDRHRRAGWVQAIGYAAAVTLASTVLAAVVYAGLGVETTNYVTLGDDRKVYYSNGASDADARALGDVLIHHNALPSGVTRVYVGKSDSEYVVSIVLNEKWDDPEVERHYGELRRSIEKQAFAPTRIRLVNSWLWPKRTIGP